MVWSPRAILLEVAGGISRLALWIAGGFRVAAPIVAVRMPNRFETAALLAAAVLILVAITRADRRWLLRLSVAPLALAVASLGAREAYRRVRRDVRVTFLDVGQGDAALVEGPGGFTALIDGGGAIDEPSIQASG